MTLILFAVSTFLALCAIGFYVAFNRVRFPEDADETLVMQLEEKEEDFALSSMICLLVALVTAWAGLLIAIIS